MKKIYTIIGVLIIIFVSPNVYAQELILAYQKKFDHKSGILNINNVTSHGNLYVIGDFKAKKVYVLNSTFELVTEFVPEKCHPGSAFNPGKITKVDEDHVLITSQPVPTYMLNIKSMDCSTRLGQESRFIPAAHMSSTGNGVLLNITRPDGSIEFSEYDNKLKRVYTITFNDVFAFKNLRYRVLNKSSILSIENYVYYLNQFDFKVIRFSKRDLISGIVNPTQITIPISNIRKPRDLSSSEVAGMDIASTVSAMRNAHAINGFYNVGSKIMFFQVYSSTESKYSLFGCKFDLNQLTNCKVLTNLGSFEMIAHVDERQMITTSYNVDDESTILRKYNIIY